MRRELLDPLAPGGSRLYLTAVFDSRADSRRDEAQRVAAEEAALFCDGVFLLRPELRDAWDLAIFVRVTPEESLRRALVRDAELLGPATDVEERYRTRYLPGQQLYLAEASPLDHTDFVVDNDDPDQPRLSRPGPRDSPC